MKNLISIEIKTLEIENDYGASLALWDRSSPEQGPLFILQSQNEARGQEQAQTTIFGFVLRKPQDREKMQALILALQNALQTPDGWRMP